MPQQPPIFVVGAGISGVACAKELATAGVPYRLLDRGQRIGGRLAVRTVDGRPIDLGASYFTAHDPLFTEVVDSFVDRGLARPWTDTFRIATPRGSQGSTTGPLRYAAARGLRSLVEDLAVGLNIEHPVDVVDVGTTDAGPMIDQQIATAVVLAMPDPQALDVLADELVTEREVLADTVWDPVLALAARWPTSCWPAFDGMFVNESAVLTFVADDGARRGDGAPVLVAHASAEFSAQFLDDPAAAGDAMLAELATVLGLSIPPVWHAVKRWGVAKPASGRSEPYFFGEARIGLVGDGWHGRPRVEAAYLSGRALGVELIRRFG